MHHSLLALMPSVPAMVPAAHADAGADIDKANRDWSAGMTQANPARIAAAYAADAVFCDAEGACTTGHDAIEKLMAGRFGHGPARSAEAHSTRRIADGGFVYEWGEAAVVDSAGEAVHGRFFTVWEQTRDGWQIFRNLVLP